MNIISYKYYSTMLITVSNEKESSSIQVSTCLSDIIKKIPIVYQQYPQITSIEVIDLRTKEILIDHKKST